MQSLKDKKLLLIPIALVIGVLIGFYSKPAKIVEKEVIKTVEVVKEVEVKSKDQKYIQIQKPDGTIITRIDTKEESKKETDSKKESLSEKLKITENQSQWSISVLIKPQNEQPLNGLVIERRILGPFKIGAFGTVDKSYGLSVGMEF